MCFVCVCVCVFFFSVIILLSIFAMVIPHIKHVESILVGTLYPTISLSPLSAVKLATEQLNPVTEPDTGSGSGSQPLRRLKWHILSRRTREPGPFVLPESGTMSNFPSSGLWQRAESSMFTGAVWYAGLTWECSPAAWIRTSVRNWRGKTWLNELRNVTNVDASRHEGSWE